MTSNRIEGRAWARPHYLLLLAIALWGARAPAQAQSSGNDAAVLTATRSFTQWSAQARPRDLDERAGYFNAAQLPLAAAALDQAERALSDFDPHSYRAMVRWHFWLAKRLDPKNRGFWSADSRYITAETPVRRVTTATLPSLELLHLQALAGMAYRRDHIFDSMVWWRDRGILQRRIARNMYDPDTGGYARFDSLGRRREHAPDLSDLLPLALGAPSDRSSARKLALRFLTDGDFEGMNDAAKRSHILMRLDPATGWPSRAGLDVLDRRQVARILGQSIDMLHHPDLSDMVRTTLSRVGLPGSGNVVLNLDGDSVSIPASQPRPRPLERSRVAVEFLSRTLILTEEETQQARAFLDIEDRLLMADTDATAATLEQLVTTWRELEPKSRIRAHSRQRSAAAPNGDPGGSAFGYRTSEAAHWFGEALDLILEDVAALRLASNREAVYEAEVEPRAMARDERPTARLRFYGLEAVKAASQGSWSGAWTDGLTTHAFVHLNFEPVDEYTANLLLPTPPPVPGLWWMILRGPEGAPTHAPAIAVVLPLTASLTPVSEMSGSHHSRFRVSISNRLVSPLEGRFEILPPVDWTVLPSGNNDFNVAARGTDEFEVEIRAPKDQAPGLFTVGWRFYDGVELVSHLEEELAVHFGWISIGPFDGGLGQPLSAKHGPDRSIELGERYAGVDGMKAWSHLSAERLDPSGWVNVGRGEPGSVFYALTAVSSTTRDAMAEIEGHGATALRVNGLEKCKSRHSEDKGQGMLELAAGANYLLVKTVVAEDGVARFRLGVRDVDGTALRAGEYSLEHLLEGYAYVEGQSVLPTPTPESLQREEMRLIPIAYHNPEAVTVSVVGNFNGWSPAATPLLNYGQGDWRAEIRLRPGRFTYKLVVNDRHWIADPANPKAEDDGFGSRNSVLVVR